MKKTIATFIGSVAFLFCLVGASQAAMSDEKIAMLEERISQLEAQLGGGAPAEAPAVVGGIEISGGISSSSVWNFDSPDNHKNGLRVFDDAANSFNVDLVEVAISKQSEELGIGGRIDLDFLDTAEKITSLGTTATDDIEVQQAYITYMCPMTNIAIKGGKFVTLLGAEVIEPWDNWNFSRSFLFNYAIPFSHVGVLGSYTFSDMVSLTAGLVNGWDVVNDNNEAKTFLGNLTLGPVSWFTLGINGTLGSEQADENDNLRGIIDLVLTVKPEPVPALTLMFNFDYGTEGDIPITVADVVVGSSDATWQGFAGYAKYDLSDRCYLAIRGEWFDDEDGARTGAAQELWEVTLTGAHMIGDGLWARLEYRHDDSDGSPFMDDDSATDTQDTLSTNLTYVF